MEKLKMHSINKVDENVEKIGKLFPNCLTERINEDGKLEQAIDFEILKQELSKVVVEGNEERYRFEWPDKKKSILLANAPISKTLRPCKEESVDFENTENLYIEGDNLDVLKLLQETYLGKVKMIYIDPPYNTKNDFIYNDKFVQNVDDYLENSGQFDDEGNRLVQNTETKGRLHTDWLNMIYPRLKVAQTLLTDDGVIFISIDDNEVCNLRKICDEIFGEKNLISEFCIIRAEGGGLAKQVIKGHEYLLCYSKAIDKFIPLSKPKDIRGKIIEKNGETYWIQENWLRKEFGKYGNCHYEEILEYKGQSKKNEIDKGIEEGMYILIPKSNGMNIVGKLRNLKEDASKFYTVLKHLSADGIKDLEKVNLTKYFDYPKPISLIKDLIMGATFFTKNSNDIILDFFSGSATTAHATMKLNHEDKGNRKFIMVQLPEETNEKSESYKDGYKTICEIGKERIRRAGKELKEEFGNLDTGFRVLKLDSSNMKDVYYNPSEYKMDLFETLKDNIEKGRTPEDLLFQVMLDLGVLLSSKIEEKIIGDKKVFNVAEGFLIACFDKNITEETIRAIAEEKPYYFVMRDSSMANDSVATNFEQIFATYSPDTIKKVL